MKIENIHKFEKLTVFSLKVIPEQVSMDQLKPEDIQEEEEEEEGADDIYDDLDGSKIQLYLANQDKEVRRESSSCLRYFLAIL